MSLLTQFADKPAPEPYRMVATELGVPVDRLRMIAAHAWDVGGALRAGCAAAFIGRPGKAAFPLFPKPDVVGNDLREVAEAIVRVELARPSDSYQARQRISTDPELRRETELFLRRQVNRNGRKVRSKRSSLLNP